MVHGMQDISSLWQRIKPCPPCIGEGLGVTTEPAGKSQCSLSSFAHSPQISMHQIIFVYLSPAKVMTWYSVAIINSCPSVCLVTLQFGAICIISTISFFFFYTKTNINRLQIYSFLTLSNFHLAYFTNWKLLGQNFRNHLQQLDVDLICWENNLER